MCNYLCNYSPSESDSTHFNPNYPSIPVVVGQNLPAVSDQTRGLAVPRHARWTKEFQYM